MAGSHRLPAKQAGPRGVYASFKPYSISSVGNYLSALASRASVARTRVSAFLETDRGRTTVRYVRYVVVAAILALLVWQLTSIGWASVLTSLPATPWFYVIFLMMYFLLPFFEVGIYRRLFRARVPALFRVLVRKRVLNNDIVGYSGEVYLYTWARKLKGVGDRIAFVTIKDNAIASSIASTLALVFLVLGFVLAGQVVLVDLVPDDSLIVVVVAVIAGVILAAVAIRFRRSIFSLSRRIVAALIATHFTRFVVMYALQVAQWWVVIPEAPLRVWATMLVVGTLTTRIPLLPARDLFAIGAILGISGLLDASQAAIAGMLMTRSALDKLVNVVLFATTSWYDRRTGSALAHPGGSEGVAGVD